MSYLLAIVAVSLVSYSFAFSCHSHLSVGRVWSGRLRSPSALLSALAADTCGPCSPNNNFTSISLIDSSSGQPTNEEISDARIVQIVTRLEEVSDVECNRLVWKCLGYDLLEDGTWSTARVFPKWAAKYPQPPDLVGVTRNFSPEVDKQVRQASMDLMRSIPRDYKGGVRNLADAGFRGFKLAELTPTKTRRAQLVNWLIYYREKLHGKSLDQLREERLASQSTVSKEQMELPSERQFQEKRLDAP